MSIYLEFEKDIAKYDAEIERLKLETGDEKSTLKAMACLEEKRVNALESLYQKLTPPEIVLVARHADRPHTLDYIRALITDFTPLAGDRLFGEDEAMIGGIGRFNGRSVVIIGQEKGHDTESRMKHNFGMPQPEGYRKATRLMQLAEQFSLPVIAFVDTAGAYPGIGAEERGQSEAIARSIQQSIRLTVPMVSIVIGEGGSGGAIAIAAADRVLMLEHAIYSVISPEGCASILWRDPAKASEAAKALKITSKDLKKLGIIDAIIKEPLGGAHRDKAQMINNVRVAIEKELKSLNLIEPQKRRMERWEKFLAMGRAEA